MPRSVLSTPESPDLHYLLGHMRDRDTGVVLEATSMGLVQRRLDHVPVDIGVFTNLTQDHLDDHGTMAHYKDAKLRLFGGLCDRAVVNADDPVERRDPGPDAGRGDHLRPGRAGRLPGERSGRGRGGQPLHPPSRRPQVPCRDPGPGPFFGVQRARRPRGVPSPRP